MTLSELQAAVYQETAYALSPPPEVTARITRWLNEGMRAILAEPGLARLADSDSPLTVSSAAGVARVVVPEAVARILSMSERTNDWVLRPMSLAAYRAIEPDPTSSTGTPTHYVPIGRVAVAAQPSDPSALFVLSDAAGDTGTVFLKALIDGGYRRVGSTPMTGTTAKQIDTLSTFIEVEDFYLATNAVGTVTLLEDSGVGTELARITQGSKRPRYYAFYLWPTPTDAITYYVDYRREVVDLANATDEPPLPTDFHPALVAYAVMREREQKNDAQRYVLAKTQYDQWIAKLKYFTQTLGDELPVMGRGAAVGHSRLGGFYPADSWRRG